jgi:hypothetical protein
MSGEGGYIYVLRRGRGWFSGGTTGKGVVNFGFNRE